jgi:hypothetical protein
MFNQVTAAQSEQLAQRKYEARNAQGKLAATERRRSVCNGYTIDGVAEECGQAYNRFTQAKAQLEEQRKITLDLTQRQPVLKLIDKFTKRL